MKKRKLLHRLICLCLVVLLLPAVPVQAADVSSAALLQVDQVLIYNPGVDPNVTMSTGDMTGQIGTASARFSLLPGEEPLRLDLDPSGLTGWESLPVPDLQQAAAKPAEEEIAVGTTKEFKYAPNASFTGKTAVFTCLYADDDCLIWGYDYDQPEVVQALGDRFTADIKPRCENRFGTGRFLENGGKLNILIYPFDQDNYLGFFMSYELLTAEEGSQYARLLNLGMPIIHINGNRALPGNYEEYCVGTIAHEFQHLLCFSSTMLGSGSKDKIQMEVWVNEAMSQYAAEMIDSGYMERNGYVSNAYNNSGLIANGQSLYDFGTSGDIGVYGQGYLFARYLEAHWNASTPVFSVMHQYWRTAEAEDLTTAKMFRSVLGQSRFGTELAAELDAVALEDADDTFLSRLNLAFQIAMVQEDGQGIYAAGKACAGADPRACIHTSVNIEGGGRILVNTADGFSYAIPPDADPDLIYVGFQNGEMTVPPTTAAEYEAACLQVLGSALSDGSRSFTYTACTSRQTTCMLVAAAYDKTTGQMRCCAAQVLELDGTRKEHTISLPDGGSLWKFYLLRQQVPILAPVTWPEAE